MKRVWILVLVSLFWVIIPVRAADDAISTSPQTHDGKKWRVAYYEAGNFANYNEMLASIVVSLGKIGWLTGLQDFPEKSDAATMWQWLSTHATGNYIEFVNDGFYSFHNNPQEHEQVRQDLIQRLSGAHDIDLLLVMGTAAGQDVANDTHKVPTLVFSVSDAVKANIVTSNEDSGRDHIWSNVQPYRYKRQVELFHDIIGFKRMGIVYADNMGGRSMAAVEDVMDLAKERGFTVVQGVFKDEATSEEEWKNNVLTAYQEIAEQNIDAMYLVLNTRQTLAMTNDLMAPFLAKSIPTFAQWAPAVQRGALMSVAPARFEGIGSFNAGTIAKVLNGAQPRSLSQVFVSPPVIELNLEVADRIGYAPPFTILLTADTVFQQIEQ